MAEEKPRPRNVLVLVEVFATGGLETHVAGMARALRAEGCTLHMAVGRHHPGPLPPEFASIAADLPFDAYAPVGEFVTAVDRLVDFVHTAGVDLIHAHPFLSLLPALLVAERTSVPLVVTLHSPSSLDLAYGPLHNQIVKTAVLPGAARVYGVSPEVLVEAQRFAAPERCRLLPNGVDLSRFAPPASTATTDRWLIISRLDGPKVEGLKDFCTKAAAIDFGAVDIIGEGPAEGALVEHVAALGAADRFRLLGQRHDVHEWIGQYAGVIGMGRVVLEGAAMNRPVLLVGYDGVKGLLDVDLATTASRSNFSGRGLPTISEAALAHQLEALAGHPKRFELRTWVARDHDEREIWRWYLRDLDRLVSTVTGVGDRLEQALRAGPEAPESYLHAPAVVAAIGDACAEATRDGIGQPAAAESELVGVLREALAQARRHDAQDGATAAAAARLGDTLATVTRELRQASNALSAAERDVERLTHELAARDATLARTEAELGERLGSTARRLTETEAALTAQTLEREALEYVVRRRTMLDRAWEEELATRIERTKSSRRYRIGNILATIPEKPLATAMRGLRWALGRYKARGWGLAEALEVWDPLAEAFVMIRKGPAGQLPVGLDPLAIRLAVQRALTAPWHGFAWEVPGLVSVVLPVFAHGRPIAATIESVLAQTHPHVELIVIADRSTEALLPYRGHANVRLLRQRPQGLAAALSNGFEVARGEFLTWVSAGNLMEARQLERQVELLQRRPELAMVYADYLALDASGAATVHTPDDASVLRTTVADVIGPCFLYRGSLAPLLGDYASTVGVEALDYWLRIAALFAFERVAGEPLHRRAPADDPGARTHPGVLGERLERLRTDEPIRQRYFSRGWKVFVDDVTDVRLAGLPLAPHVTAPLDPASGIPASGEECLLLVHPSSLPQVAAHALPPECVVVAWFDVDDPTPYRHGAQLQRLVHLCLVADTATAERCAIFTRRVLRATTPRDALALATAFASNHLWSLKTIPGADRERSVPEAVLARESPLRVVLEVDGFEEGGLERVVLDLAAVLRSTGIEVTIAVLGRMGRAADEARQKGFDVVGIPATDREVAYWDLIVERRIDLVNAHFSIAGAPLAAARGIPFVQTIHNTYVWLSDSQIAAYRQADANTAAYVCVSPLVASDAESRLGLPASKFVVIPNGIDVGIVDAARETVRRDEERQSLGWQPGDRVLLCAASISPSKAQLHQVRALALARRDVPHLRLALLGEAVDAEYAARVKHEITSLGLENAVDVLGYSDTPHRFYFLADAFVLPSFIEGWSLALAEALYAGLPTLATDVGAAGELLAQTGGRLLAAPLGVLAGSNAESFGQAIRADSPSFVTELAAAFVALAREPEPPLVSQQLADSFDRARALHAYVDLFRDLVAGEPLSGARPKVWELHAGRTSDCTRTARPTVVAGTRSRQAAPAFEPGDRSVDEVLQRMRGMPPAVVFLRSIESNTWLFQRLQHLARSFARLGHPTVYDDGVTRTGFLGFREIEPNLFLYRGDTEQLAEVPEPLLWALCCNYHLRDRFSSRCPVVYDIIDHPSVHFVDPTRNAGNHQRAVREATIVTYVARHLEGLLDTRPDRLYLPNAVDHLHFEDSSIRLPLDREMHRILREAKPIAGYYGALAEWFDYALLERTARLRPDWNFVLIGQRYDDSVVGQTVLTLPNVRWLGPREYTALPAYLRLFDVATIPFCINDVTLATSPLKLYEYFAGGKPVVTTPIPECMTFPEVTIVRTANEFAAALEPARRRGRDPAFQARLRHLAACNSWLARARTVVQAYESLRGTGSGRAPAGPH